MIYAQVLKFSPHEIVAWVQYGIHSVPEALLVFGLCRAPTESWTAKLLTHPLFLGFVPYTFAAYIIHFPVLLFAQFVRIEGINSLRGLFRRVYRHKNCYESDWINRARGDHETEDDEAAACVEINQCVGCSRSRVDGVEDDATIQHERAVRF